MERIEEEVRGVLNYERGRHNYELTRLTPSPALAPYVMIYWLAQWDLRGQAPQVQENIPHPSVHLVIERERSEIVGVVTKKYTRLLEGAGGVIGVKFQPGGFSAFMQEPVATITDRALPLEAVFGSAADGLEAEVLAEPDPESQARRLEAFLLARQPERSGFLANIETVATITAWVTEQPQVTRVDHIVEHFKISKRRLQRLFQTHVGISPKWIIKKYRMHEALAQIETKPVNWSALAHDLGYFDQAHFIKDFKDLIGQAPRAYAESNERRPG